MNSPYCLSAHELIELYAKLKWDQEFVREPPASDDTVAHNFKRFLEFTDDEIRKLMRFINTGIYNCDISDKPTDMIY